MAVGSESPKSETPAGKPATDMERPPQRIHEPAVAGLFYPRDPAELRAMLDELFAQARPHDIPGLKALVCPHAGYIYSGPVAAEAYRTLVNRSFETVILIAPSHYASFRGAAVLDADAFRTPLGLVRISPKAHELAKRSPFFADKPCYVQRPPWSWQSSKPAPPHGQDTPHTWEHSSEVQVPFLQKALRDFALVPVVIGQADPAELAEALGPFVDEGTLIVASSDLSHYHPYEMARRLDLRCVQAMVDLDLEEMQDQEACGKLPILTVMHLAKARGWKARLLDYRNSGDTAGDKSHVVGYAAVAFYAPGGQSTARETYTREEKRALLELARRTLRQFLKLGTMPEVEAERLPAKLREPKGCFVTLTKNGALRGCIGHIFPQEPLYQAVMDNARAAATRDPRFPPVTPEELDELEIEISILTVPQPVQYETPQELLDKLRPGVDGVVFRLGGRTSTYLPQVWEKLKDKEIFMDSLAMKAGCPPRAWQDPDAQILTYQVEHFTESEV